MDELVPTLRWLDALDLAGLNPGKKEVDAARIAAVRTRGKDVSVWTVNDAATVRKLAGWGARRVISDVPDMCLKALGR